MSDPQWRYSIRLENMASETVQLRERHWRIFSLSGTLETVRGRGIIGKVSGAYFHIADSHFTISSENNHSYHARFSRKY